MTASRNTILALAAILLALAAGKSAPGAFLGFDAAPNDASSSPGIKANSDAPDNSAANSDCNAGCDADCGAGCAPQVQGPEAGCPQTWGLEDEPSFKVCQQCFKDLCETCQGCTWKAEASVLIMHRSTPGTQTVLFDSLTAADRFDASRLEFPFAAGPRISLTALDCEGWGFEVNLFGIDGWSAAGSGSLPNGGNLVVDNSGVPIPLTDARFTSIARLYSTELNLRKPLFGNFSVLAGFRWLDMTDQYSVEGNISPAVGGGNGSEAITTHNHLLGSQIGIDGTLVQHEGRWRINGFVKAGLFLNDANQTTSTSNTLGIPVPPVSATQVVAHFSEKQALSATSKLPNTCRPAADIRSCSPMAWPSP